VSKKFISAGLCVICALMASAVVPAPSALAANSSKSAALESWYQKTGHPLLGKLVADAERFRQVNSSTTERVERQDCKAFKRDVLAASSGKLPPQPALAQEYRYFLLAAAKGFTECVTGLDSTNTVRVIEGTEVGAQAAEAVLRIITGAKAGQPVSVPLSTVNLKPPIPASVLVPQCESDFKVLEVAVAAYNAQRNSDPVPPVPWSATT
jgi:hypothetical protein